MTAGADQGHGAARGKAARATVPRSAHAGWEAPPGRDPVAILEGQAPQRVPELVPIRYGRMLESPFAFYRGAAAVMAADLAATPTTGIRVQLCGDAHLGELRRLRLARARAGLRHQRLRRDAARPVGVGREAARGERRRRRPRQRDERGGVPRRRGRLRPRLPRGDAGLRAPGQPRGLVRAPRQQRHRRGVERAGGEGRCGAHTQAGREGPRQGPASRLLEADDGGGRSAAHHQRSAADRASRRAGARAAR